MNNNIWFSNSFHHLLIQVLFWVPACLLKMKEYRV